MTERPDPFLEALRWVEKAEHDLRNAEHTLTLDEDCPYDTACFHAQQCVEKYLKAALIAASIPPPMTHDLRLLAGLVLTKASVPIDLGSLMPLNRYSVEARYPGDWEPIDRVEAEDAVRRARQVRFSVRAFLGLEERPPLRTA